MRTYQNIFAGAMITALLSLLTVCPTYAGWIKSETVPTEAGKSSWWYSTDAANNTWYAGNPVMWQWIDGNKDGVFECYAFGTDGWMFANTITPDSYTVNVDGAWIIDGIVQTKLVSTKTDRNISFGGGGSGGGGGGGSSSGTNKPIVKPEPEKPAPIPEKPTPEPEQPEIITFSYTIQYRDIESKEILREEVGQAEKNNIIEIEHRTFNDYKICNEQPTSFQLTYNNAKEIVYYQKIRSATPSEAQEIQWEVNFVDVETHQKKIFPQRSGVVLEGGSLYVNYMPSITIEGMIWKALDTPPFETEVYGPGDQIYYIEFEKAGIIPEPEDSKEKKLLRKWFMAAKEAEANITGEIPEQILDSRFIVSNKTQNDARVRSIINGISDESSYTFYIIGRNYIPNGLAITEWYGRNADYAITAEDTIQIEGDQYTVVRINVSLTSESEHDHHYWELINENPATCSLKGNQLYECKICGEQMEADLPAHGHMDEDDDTICDVCGEIIGTNEPAGTHWNLGDIQVQELDGEIYFFKCIDQNYSDRAENHNQMALFLSTTIVPANYGSQYKYEKLPDGTYDYVFYPGPLTSFGTNNDYKYSKVRKWLNELESDTYNLGNTSIGISYAYLGATVEGAGDQLQESDLTASYIGDQKMTDQLFILSVDEALKYKDYLWKVESTGAFSKGYWLRSPMGTSTQYNTDYAYIVDLVNENIRAQSVSAAGSGSDEEINVTGTTGVRLAYTLPQN